MASRSATRESNSEALTSRIAGSRWATSRFCQSSCSLLGSTPFGRQVHAGSAPPGCDLAVDKRFGHREFVLVHQVLDDLVLGLALRLFLRAGRTAILATAARSSSMVR